MENLNYCCAGCAFAGAVDGYEPECNCAKKEAILASIANNDGVEACIEYVDYVDELLPSTPDTVDQPNVRQMQKSRRMRRRIDAKNSARRTPESLAIATARFNRLPVDADSASFEVANKRCFNAAKKAVYAYKTSVSIRVLELPNKIKFGSSLDTLINVVSLWGSESDVSILRTALAYNGQLVGLHRESKGDNSVLQVKIGFRDKASKLDFIRRTVAA